MARQPRAATEAGAKAGTETTAKAGTEPRADATGGTTGRSPEDLTERREDLRFHALRSALYHQDRRSFCERLHRWQMFGVIMAGSGAVAALAAECAWLTPVLALLAAASAATDLAFGWGAQAQEHTYLARRYYELLAGIEESDPTEESLRKCSAATHRLYAEERPPMRAIDAIAYNAAQASLYGERGKRIKLGWHHTLFRNFHSFARTEFRWVEDGGTSTI